MHPLAVTVDEALETLDARPIDWPAALADWAALLVESRGTSFVGAAEFLGWALDQQDEQALRTGLLSLRARLALESEPQSLAHEDEVESFETALVYEFPTPR